MIQDIAVFVFGLIAALAGLSTLFVMFAHEMGHLPMRREKTLIELVKAGYIPCLHDELLYWRKGDWEGTMREALKRERFLANLRNYKVSEPKTSEPAQMPDWRN